MLIKERNLIFQKVKDDVFLSQFSDEIVERLVDNLILRKYSRNQLIYFPYEPSKFLYLVHKGKVRITTVLEDGKKFTFRHATDGDFFGEEGVFGIPTRNSFAESILISEVWVIPSIRFYELLTESSEVAFNYSKKLFFRTILYESSMLKMISYPVIVRVVNYLSTEMKKIKASEGVLKITHQEIANILGVRRETVSNCLRELEYRGFIEKQKGSIIVKDIDKMENWCKRSFSIKGF